MKKYALVLCLFALCFASVACRGGATDSNGNSGTSAGGAMDNGTPEAGIVPPEASPGDDVEIVITFSEAALPIDLGAAMNTVICASDERLYFNRTKLDYSDFSVAASEIVSVNFDGGDERIVWAAEEADGSMLLTSFAVDDDESLWLLAAEPLGDTYSSSLIKLLATGEELLTVNLVDIDAAMYPQNIVLDGGGNAYLYSGQTVYAFSGTTGALEVSFVEGEYVYGAARSGDGDISYVFGGADGSAIVRSVDFEARAVDGGAVYNGVRLGLGYGGEFGFFGTPLAAGVGEYDLTYRYGDYIFGLDRRSMREEVIVDFIASGIDSTDISAFYPLSDGRFFLRRGAAEFSILTPTELPADERVVVTLGTTFMDSNTRAAVLDFNRTSAEARIEVVDYTSFATADDPWNGILQLERDVMDGSAPDIVSLHAISPARLIDGGALEDLNPYLNADATLERAELFDNVLRAASDDGGLYSIPPFFTVQTVAGKASIFGETATITISDVEDIWNRYPEAELMASDYAIVSAPEFVTTAVNSFAGSSYAVPSGETYFAGEEFVAVLEFSTQLPAQALTANIFDTQIWQSNLTQFSQNRTLLYQTSITSPMSIRLVDERFGETAAFVGFPTLYGGGSAIMPSSNLAISAASQHKNAAWKFIAFQLRTAPTSGNVHAIPINRSHFLIELSTALGEGSPEAARLLAAVDSAETLYCVDPSLLLIVTEEVETMLYGKCSPREAAEAIAARAATYVRAG